MAIGDSTPSVSARAQDSETRDHRDRARRMGRRGQPLCEVLEDRVVLSGWGGGALFQSLSNAGVVTSPVVANSPESDKGSSTNQNSKVAQLQTDLQALQKELQSLAAKSGVTVADLTSLTNDGQAIAQAGYHFNIQNLDKVINELASAVAGGSSTSQAQSDFAALFTGSNVSQSVITQTFNDLVNTITDSKVTTTDLSTVATDEAAVQTDLSKLPWGRFGREGIPFGFGGGFEAFDGGALLQSLSNAGVITHPIATEGSETGEGSSTSQNPKVAQLQTDVQKLQTELQSLAAKSGVTVADLTSLGTDSQAIAQARYHFNVQSLNKVINELATAVASGSSTSQAQSDFAALFTGSNVSQSVITQTFNDLVQTITDSKVTSTDLSTVAADEAAVQTDLTNLRSSSGNGSGGTFHGHPGGPFHSFGRGGRF